MPGRCGCGEFDIAGCGRPGPQDLCPDDLSKFYPGVCGCGVPDTDSNGNGLPDCLETLTPPPPPEEPGDDDDVAGQPTPPEEEPADESILCGIGCAPAVLASLFGLLLLRFVPRRRRF